jgi:pyruvate,water dikinase
VDRDSEIVAPLFDERNQAVKSMIASVINVAKAKGKRIGICGQAPSDYPDFAKFLVEQGIDSISLNPDTVLKTTVAVVEIESVLQR